MQEKLDFSKTVERWRKYSEQYFKDGRFLFIDCIKLFLTIATFLIGFSIIGLQLVLDEFTLFQKASFLISILSLLFSVIFGLWALLNTNSFLNRAGDHYEKKAEKLNDYMLKTGESTGENYPKGKQKLDYYFKPWQIYIQVILVGIGFIASALFILSFIF